MYNNMNLYIFSVQLFFYRISSFLCVSVFGYGIRILNAAKVNFCLIAKSRVSFKLSFVSCHVLHDQSPLQYAHGVGFNVFSGPDFHGADGILGQ